MSVLSAPHWQPLAAAALARARHALDSGAAEAPVLPPLPRHPGPRLVARGGAFARAFAQLALAAARPLNPETGPGGSTTSLAWADEDGSPVPGAPQEVWAHEIAEIGRIHIEGSSILEVPPERRAPPPADLPEGLSTARLQAILRLARLAIDQHGIDLLLQPRCATAILAESEMQEATAWALTWAYAAGPPLPSDAARPEAPLRLLRLTGKAQDTVALTASLTEPGRHRLVLLTSGLRALPRDLRHTAEVHRLPPLDRQVALAHLAVTHPADGIEASAAAWRLPEDEDLLWIGLREIQKAAEASTALEAAIRLAAPNRHAVSL
ncbi:hypothetical protein [Pseudoroseicyclus aestuarii]|uniref:Uncharacterized protein n=1 Tax=Pseudoroseicyclus aestuarii TaxID=1795041 RepID=A0A318SN21_9RHOB|nr:hypothetical protein [Pseudoroseicyclus aestuarii]PYE82203.1 hypothetical protein DFP88_10543 [Pseudoroseicyclus aestuarii]